jgi:hypothetical protein
MAAGYTVIGLDIDGFDVAGGNEWDTFREADKAARRLVTEREAIDAGMHKVEIHNVQGECVRDYFVK